MGVSVQQKLEELTARFQEEKETVPKDMEARGEELKKMLDLFQKELAEERNDRLNREGRILKQMDDLSSSLFKATEEETIIRDMQATQLQMRIEENERLRTQSEYELQLKVQNEMSELQGMIEREKEERALGDDEIINALNKYTQQLQSSLSCVLIQGIDNFTH